MKKFNLLMLSVLLYGTSTTAREDNSKIFQAVHNGDKQAVRNELYNCADCTVKDKDGNTVLHIAAQKGFKEIAELLLEYNDNWFYKPTLPNIDDVNENGDTVIHAAITGEDDNYENRAEVAEYLLKKNPNLATKINKAKLSPAFATIKKDDPRFIRVLNAHLDFRTHKYNGETICTYAVKENKPTTMLYCVQKTSLSNVANNDNKTPILLAIDKENIPVLELFKENINSFAANTAIKPIHYATANNKRVALDYILTHSNASINEPDKDGNPPLFHAIDSDNEQMFNYLLYRGANLKNRNKQGEDALAIATYNQHLHLMNVLVKEHKVDIDARDNNGRTSFMRASIEQNHAAMEELLKLEANSGLTDNNRENSLHKAARNGDKKGANIILKSDKSSLKAINKDGNIPLQTAYQNNQFALAKILLDAGSLIDPQLINHKNNKDETAIFFAAQNNDAVSIRNLINAKAEYLTIADIHGLTLMHHAAKSDAVEAIQELKRQGVSLRVCTPAGNNPAHTAAGYGKIKSLKYLQTEPELLDECNKKGQNVFSYAAMEGQLEAVKLLLREEYFIKDIVIHTINSLATSPTHNNNDVRKFLTKEHNTREKKCQAIDNVCVEGDDLKKENKRSADFLFAQGYFLDYFTYAPSELKRMTINDLYHLPESERTEYFNDCVKFKNKELDYKRDFEKKIITINAEQQKALAKQQADERAKQERIRRQQQEELDRIAERNRQEQARLKQELERQNRQSSSAKATADTAEQERIATQQGTTIEEQRAALKKIEADKYTADIVAHQKHVAEEKARVRAEEDARGKQARAAERARIEAENKRLAEQQAQPIPQGSYNYPLQEQDGDDEILEQGDCCISADKICTEEHGVKRLRCPGCKIGSIRTCDACIAEWIAKRKSDHLPITCPGCNKVTLSEKLKK